MIEVGKRETVWFVAASGMTYPGIVIWRRVGWVRVLYWDCDGEHHRVTRFLPGTDYLYPRASEPWSSSCGGMSRPQRSEGHENP